MIARTNSPDPGVPLAPPQASESHDEGAGAGSITFWREPEHDGLVGMGGPVPPLEDGTCDDGCYYGRKSQRDSASICFWVVVIGFALAVVAWVWCGMPLG